MKKEVILGVFEEMAKINKAFNSLFEIAKSLAPSDKEEALYLAEFVNTASKAMIQLQDYIKLKHNDTKEDYVEGAEERRKNEHGPADPGGRAPDGNGGGGDGFGNHNFDTF